MRIEFPISVGNRGLLTVEMCCDHPTLCIYILLAPGCGLLPISKRFLLWSEAVPLCGSELGQFLQRGLAQPREQLPTIQIGVSHPKPTGICTQWFNKHEPNEPYKHPWSTGSPLWAEHLFGHQHREPLGAASGQATPTLPLSAFVTPTKNIITCIMIKQSVI